MGRRVWSLLLMLEPTDDRNRKSVFQVKTGSVFREQM